MIARNMAVNVFKIKNIETKKILIDLDFLIIYSYPIQLIIPHITLKVLSIIAKYYLSFDLNFLRKVYWAFGCVNSAG